MDKRLEYNIERAIHSLRESSGSLMEHRLQRRIVNSGGDNFYDIKFLIKRMVQLELVEDNGQYVTLTKKGWDFFSFDNIRYEKYKEQQSEQLANENLKLQNENLAMQNSTYDRQTEIDKLTIENLKLQNRQLKRYVIYSIIAFLTGAILTNIKDILNLIQSTK